MGVTYEYFGAPDRAAAARVPPLIDPLDPCEPRERPSNSYISNVKPETVSAMVLSLLGDTPREATPPLELVVLHPAHAVMQLPPILLEVLRNATDEELGAAAFIWSTVPDRRIPRDAYLLYRMLHDWTAFAHELHRAGDQLYCLMHS
ncbi:MULTISPECIES: hypothetical protein [Streptomycetaceae]|uniref:Uncharacterized protein n=1 Tax=Streptodolium elevatio TaxID=3157996 RepID=A0ABV3DSR6_9ACTN|nr:hypothetical protein [Yinghuangia sp.]